MNSQKKYVRFILGISFSFVCAVMLQMYVYCVEHCQTWMHESTLSQIALSQSLRSNTIITFFVLLVITALIVYYGNKIGEFVYRYRFFIAVCFFVICVILELNGSSIGLFSAFLGGTDDTVLGMSRGIRSDEWAVSTPMMLSQYQNSTGVFPYFSNTVRAASTDMFLVYGQPVANVAIIFRPFYWGYLFLSQGKGLAFFWCGRYIALFVVTFEFAMLITKKKKDLSVIMAMLVLFAPVVQWWFAINGFVEMLIFAQFSIILLHYYMKEDNWKLRILYVLGILISAGGFILTIYPAWEVPMCYVILGLIIWTIWENYKSCTMTKKDWLIISFGIIIFLILMAYIFIKSSGTIKSVTGTVYPGKRSETGGGMLGSLFYYISNIWYAMTGEHGLIGNAPESAHFIDFFPVCYVPPFILFFREKKKDKLLLILTALCLFLGSYSVFGFPDVLAKISLLSNSQSSRAVIIFGFCNLLLMIRALSLLEKPFSRISSCIFSAIVMGVGLLVCRETNVSFFRSKMVIVLTVVIFCFAFYFLLRYPKKLAKSGLLVTILVIAVLSGFLVNPIRQGVGELYSVPSISAISEVCEDNPGTVWAVEGERIPYINAGILCGAPTINSTNVYPDNERWKEIDKTGKYEKVYNRYAHIVIDIKKSGEAEFEKTFEDEFRVHLTLSDLKKLGVDYIFTKNDLGEKETQNERVELQKESDGYKIYKIVSK
ncbi:MAG: hypothetical protein PHN80_09350 [Hespellia sp.]|nr:hypothetical protein [Hespellia sp.]